MSKTIIQNARLRAERYFLYHAVRLFRIRRANEKVARGFALGLVVNFLPTFGFGVFVSGVFARLFGGNVVAGFAGGALLTLFWPFLFYLNMRSGAALLGDLPISDPSVVTERFIQARVWGKTFLLGAVANSLLVGLAVYLTASVFFRKYRERAMHFFHKWMIRHQRRAAPFLNRVYAQERRFRPRRLRVRPSQSADRA
jgi:uncharacterized protein